MSNTDLKVKVWRGAQEGEFVAHTFGRQALPIVWDLAEAVPFLHRAAAEMGDDQPATTLNVVFQVAPQRIGGGQALGEVFEMEEHGVVGRQSR